MRHLCDLCRRDTLEPVYQPDGTRRGISIHLCIYCGLVQSLPRADTAMRAPSAVSCAADWGNVRYGKGFRTQVALDGIGRHVDLGAPLSVLDVGSNRGRFAQQFLAHSLNASLVAVEPDERFAFACAELPRTELINARIENIALESERFDLVHSCHTIEHLAHPSWALSDHWRVLKPGGYLVLDAPNIDIIGSDDIVEEWFIDKHLYHFSSRTLTRMVESVGFTIVEQPDPRDRENLFIVARKAGRSVSFVDSDIAEVENAKSLVANYIVSRSTNLAALGAAAAELSSLTHRGVAIWGAGRLFDSLVVHGHFDARALRLLIDKHLNAFVGERHGCVLAGPEALADAKPGVVVVMSRGFAGEIEAEARKLAPQAEIITYSDLIARARKAA